MAARAARVRRTWRALRAVAIGTASVLLVLLLLALVLRPYLGHDAYTVAGHLLAAVAAGVAGWQWYVNRRLRRQMRQLKRSADALGSMAMHDPLTGLFNRRYLLPTLAREVHRANRAGTPLAVIMLDFDHFKRVNDRLGHEVGDELLRQFGALLQQRTRGDDIASRYGGEEFVVVLPNASLADARARAEQLRILTRQLPIQEKLRPVGVVTVSAGVAALPEHGTTAQALLHAADLALYRAKAAGRDRVVVAKPPTVTSSAT